MHALKQAWARFRSLPMAVQVASWVVMGLLVLALVPGGEDHDTDTAAARLPTSIERATTTETEAKTTSSTTSSTPSNAIHHGGSDDDYQLG